MVTSWTDDLSVNDNTIDQQHQRWIKLVDDFYEGIRDKKPKETLEELLLGMLEYTRYHFKYEEEHMAEINFPNLEHHKAEHAGYIAKIEDYYDRLMSDKLILSVEVTNYLKTWLINHIRGEDQQYAEK